MYRNILSSLSGLVLIRLRTLSKRGSDARDLAILMDATYYLENNPDLTRSLWSPLWHYLLFGAAERRNPHPLFDTAFYVASYPDVDRSGMNPLFHYILYGGREGRSPNGAWSNLRPDADLKTVSTNPLVRRILRLARWRQESGLPARRAGNGFALPAGVTSTQGHPAAAKAAKLRLVAASRQLAESLAGCDALVSVVIPTYNYGKCVLDAIGSVHAQTYPHIEVIVVDDESTDLETIAVLDAIRNPRVRVIRQLNQGLAQTRNNGAAAARGEYLMFLDCDDRLERHAVALLLYALQSNPSCAYAYPYQRFFGDQELVWEAQSFNAYDLLWSNHPTVCSLMRRSAFDQAGGYKPEFVRGGEDWELYLRLSGRGCYGVCVPAPVFEYRRHGTSMSHSAKERERFLDNQILAINTALYQPEAVTSSKRTWRPLISVIIPFYNRPCFLRETLASLETQTTADFEVLLVNDGSDDPESLAILDEFRNHDWIRVLDCAHGGPGAARNAGAVSAHADLLMFLDSDDLLDSCALEKMCWTIARHPEMAFVYSGVVHFGEIQAVTYDEFEPTRLYRENYLTVTCAMWRNVFLELGGHDPALVDMHEDYDFWLRLVERDYRGMLLREPLFLYRRHGAGISAQRIQRSAGSTISAACRQLVGLVLLPIVPCGVPGKVRCAIIAQTPWAVKSDGFREPGPRP
jgi:glycosyltransferase involved in cell wall biosynthesis